jgi:hypothetical protein
MVRAPIRTATQPAAPALDGEHVHPVDGAPRILSPAGSRRFDRAPRLRQEDVEASLADAIGRIERQVNRHVGAEDDDRDRLAERDPALAALLKAAILGRHASEREPDKRLAVGSGPVQPKPHGRNCAQALGFSLHANTRLGQGRSGALAARWAGCLCSHSGKSTD